MALQSVECGFKSMGDSPHAVPADHAGQRECSLLQLTSLENRKEKGVEIEPVIDAQAFVEPGTCFCKRSGQERQRCIPQDVPRCIPVISMM